MSDLQATPVPSTKDSGTYVEPKDSTDSFRAARLEVDDAATYIDKDGSNNLTLTDAVTGTKTLAQLSAGAGADVKVAVDAAATADYLGAAAGAGALRVTAPMTKTDGGDFITLDVDDMVGDAGAGGTAGLVPAPGAGDTAANKYLKANGVWTTPPGSGDVTSAAAIVDHTLVRGDGGVKGVQDTGIVVDDTDNMAMNGGTITGVGHGIADNQALTVDDAAAADNDYGKFTANGIEGVPYATVLTDIAAMPLAGGTFTGNVIFADAQYVTFTSPSASHTYSGFVKSCLAHENLVFGDVCYINGDEELVKANADAIATMPAICMAVASINADASGLCLFWGFVHDDTFAFAHTGGAANNVYVSATTAGLLTTTAPSGSSDVVQIMGHALATDQLFFNPNLEVIELVA